MTMLSFCLLALQMVEWMVLASPFQPNDHLQRSEMSCDAPKYSHLLKRVQPLRKLRRDRPAASILVKVN